jgi:hypothetical protein
MSWRIYYDDGTTISSARATPSSLVRRVGVQVIAQDDSEHRWVTVSDYDYYVWDKRGGKPQWFGASDRTALDLYLQRPGEKYVLFGYMIDKYRYREIFNDARKHLGEKAGYNAKERLP